MTEGDGVADEFSIEEDSLRASFEKSEQELQRMQHGLHLVDKELTEHAEKSHHYEVLGQVCRSLEELDSLGASELFWPADDDLESRHGRLEDARNRIDTYSARIDHLENLRTAIVAKIGDQNYDLDQLQYDLDDIAAHREVRKNEWLVERDANEIAPHTQVMPWSRGYEEDIRFRKSLASSVAASILLALLVGAITIPITERDPVNEVPERVARLVEQNRALPEPEPAPVFEEEMPEPEPEPEELAETTPEEPEPVGEPSVAENVEVDTREQVRSKGILAFRESFANSASLRSDTKLGSQARLSSAGENAASRPSRSMLTTNAQGSSGGINLADISRDVGGGGQAIDGVSISRVSSSIGTGGGGSSNRPMSGGAYAGRTDEEIQIVFDRYKSSLYRLYNRELRRNPTLRGQITLKLTIEPDGSVSFCVMEASDMNAPELAQQVVDRVSGFDFGAKEDIVAVTIIYPIDFLPAA